MNMNFLLPKGFLVNITPRTVGTVIRAIKASKILTAVNKPLEDVDVEYLICEGKK